jgi:hypothetical protein
MEHHGVFNTEDPVYASDAPTSNRTPFAAQKATDPLCNISAGPLTKPRRRTSPTGCT